MRRAAGAVVVLLLLAGGGYLWANQLRLAAGAVDMPDGSVTEYEYGETGRISFAGTYSLYQRFVVAPGNPEEVCADLERALGSDFSSFETSASNPGPCEWQGQTWGSRLRVSVLEERELAPNNRPIAVPDGSSLILVVAD